MGWGQYGGYQSPAPTRSSPSFSYLQVLSEIATYRAPSMAAAGCYTLKKEAWREFDPHFLHYGKRTLSRAWERALQVWRRLQDFTLVWVGALQVQC